MTGMVIKTGSWFSKLPDDHVLVGISRGAPRNQAAGYRLYGTLAPGKWFARVTLPVYLERYKEEVLDALDPLAVFGALERLADGKTPVLCCYETAKEIGAGKTYCHRHLAAKWLEDRLDIQVDEIDAPADFDRFALMSRFNLERPTYR